MMQELKLITLVSTTAFPRELFTIEVASIQGLKRINEAKHLKELEPENNPQCISQEAPPPFQHIDNN